MVGAQNATKIASSLSPFKNKYSDTMIIERTTSRRIQFITPIFSIKFLNICWREVLLKDNFFEAVINKIHYETLNIYNNRRKSPVLLSNLYKIISF